MLLGTMLGSMINNPSHLYSTNRFNFIISDLLLTRYFFPLTPDFLQPNEKKERKTTFAPRQMSIMSDFECRMLPFRECLRFLFAHLGWNKIQNSKKKHA